MLTNLRTSGISAALAAAALFGAATPVAKLLLGHAGPWLLAGLLYLGSGVGLFIVRVLARAPRVSLEKGEAKWLVAAITAGGVAGPVLLMWGLARLPASSASLLLNAEGVLTALLAWFVFRENFDRRIAVGMAAIVAGALVLSWPAGGEHGPGVGSVIGSISGPGVGAGIPSSIASAAVVLACLCWAIDNNLTRKVALSDASFIAMTKGLAAGAVNTAIALSTGAVLPSMPVVGAAAVIGFLGYGLSLVLFVVALRGLGTARTGAYFSTAPFIGAAIAIPLLGESPTLPLLAGGALMAFGVWLHLTERHEHAHTHEAIEHEHEHVHDLHHGHEHSHGQPSAAAGVPHVHRHRHDPLTHSHPHFPDAHHRHPH